MANVSHRSTPRRRASLLAAIGMLAAAASAATASPAAAIATGAPAVAGVPDPRRPFRVVVSVDQPPPADGTGAATLEPVDALLRSLDASGRGQARRVVAVVFHGEATVLASRDPASGAFGAPPSKSAGIAAELDALHRAGVRLLVSARSLQLRGLAATDVRPGIDIVPSAALAFLDLENQGYVYTSVAGLSKE